MYDPTSAIAPIQSGHLPYTPGPWLYILALAKQIVILFDRFLFSFFVFGYRGQSFYLNMKFITVLTS